MTEDWKYLLYILFIDVIKGKNVTHVTCIHSFYLNDMIIDMIIDIN